MLRRLGSHLTNQWMGALSLFLVLGGGAAYAVGTVGSEDIIDESVRSIDVRNGQVRSADVRDDTQRGGGLGAADLAPGSVGASELNPLAFVGLDISRATPTSPFEIATNAIQGSEVSDGTLTGLDITESTLGGFDGHDAYRDLCDTPSDNSFRDCLTVTFALGRAMDVLVVYGGGGSHGSFDSDSGLAVGECRTKVDGVNRLEPVNLATEWDSPVGMASIINVIPLSAGTHTVALACREDPTDMHFRDLTIGVVELGFD
ncbi:hypothetical protein D0Z08_13450 [Nocardioides immobilis]|uniref:Uncharacterized protein n=1 Tax=Nocardioides immobilis TaxID=2049295 RepID=A0A417Y2E4_9ACTN|nr:hypothetical protein [Nocardioides immobilis]RHW26751.1 hypothetical protein D0Z08_13450 [Nocardioides immobilis]